MASVLQSPQTSQRLALSVRQISTLDDVSLVDSEGTLVMFCYEHDLDMGAADEMTQECRGIVFDEDGQLVSRAFGYTPVYVAGRSVSEEGGVPAEIDEMINQGSSKFYRAHEGTLLRIFYHSDRWYLTTHRKLNAFKSYWGTRKSFGDLFVEGLRELGLTLPDFLDSLDKERQYVFLIHATKENRIVDVPSDSVQRLTHIGTFFSNGEMAPMESTLKVPTQTEISGLNSYDDVDQYVLDNQVNVVIFLPNQKQIKLCHPDYLYKFNLRGNESSVMFRYLQLRNSGQKDDFVALYPEYAQKIAQYEEILQSAGVSKQRLARMNGVQLNRLIRTSLKPKTKE